MEQISEPVGMVENEYQVNNDGRHEKIVHNPWDIGKCGGYEADIPVQEVVCYISII